MGAGCVEPLGSNILCPFALRSEWTGLFLPPSGTSCAVSRAMALDLAEYLKGAFADVAEGDDVDVDKEVLYFVDKLHRANIRDMFGRWWGTPICL